MLVWINDWVNYHDIGDDHGNIEMLPPPSSPPLLPASPEKDWDCCTNEGILACRKVNFVIERNICLVVNIKLWISILKEYRNCLQSGVVETVCASFLPAPTIGKVI